MKNINLQRVFLGGLVAGLILNIGEYVLNEIVFGAQWEAVAERLNLEPMGGGAIVALNVWGFLVGIAAVWLYAGFRPCCGAGPKTALCAGLTVWFLTWLMGLGVNLVLGIFPAELIIISLIWGLIEAPVATLAGAWLYHD